MGTVRGVDDTGSIMVKWDNGSGLSVVYGEDKCRSLSFARRCIEELLVKRGSRAGGFLSDRYVCITYFRGSNNNRRALSYIKSVNERLRPVA